MGNNHWQYIHFVDEHTFTSFSEDNIVLPLPKEQSVLPNTALYVQCQKTGKRREAIYDSKVGGIRKLIPSKAPNRELKLYKDALRNPDISIIVVDGLMGTGKTSTAIEEICETYLKRVSSNPDSSGYKIFITKPHVNSGGKHEDYGHLPGTLDEKLDPTLINFIQYFDRFHVAGYQQLKEHGRVQLMPLGFIRGLDAKRAVIVLDEAQNTSELVSLVTRKAEGSKIIILGDSSPFQIDTPGNTSTNNGMVKLIDLLEGAPYFQHIEMKTVGHIVRSEEVKDIVSRLFKQYGKDINKWNEEV